MVSPGAQWANLPSLCLASGEGGLRSWIPGLTGKFGRLNPSFGGLILPRETGNQKARRPFAVFYAREVPEEGGKKGYRSVEA